MAVAYLPKVVKNAVRFLYEPFVIQDFDLSDNALLMSTGFGRLKPDGLFAPSPYAG